jgi:hypothetical protein
VYQLGHPGRILRAAGFPDQPIELTAKRLAEKAEQRNHIFDIADVKGLPEALQILLRCLNTEISRKPKT